MRRLTTRQLQRGTHGLDTLFDQLDLVDIDDDLTDRAGELTQARSLRPCDAIHLAAAHRLGLNETVLVAGDPELLAAARATELLSAACRVGAHDA